MKIKIIKHENELIAEYVREKAFHKFRKAVFLKILSDFQNDLSLYLNTSSNIRQLTKDEIFRTLDDNGIIYHYDETRKKPGGLLSFAGFLQGKKKNKKTDLVLFADLSGSKKPEKLYDNLLMNYDYALCIGGEKSLEELAAATLADAMSTLFNKGVFKNTIYDSVLFRRLRVDAPYEFLKEFVNEFVSHK